jgi:hypothetical protein
MPTFTGTKSYSDGNPLTEDQLDDLKGSIETFLNTTKIDGDNIQAGGIPAAALASNSVETAKINAGAVTTAKLADSAVTTAKITDANVTLAKMAASSVGTSQVVDGAITQAKRAARTVTTDGTDPGAGGVSISASSGVFDTAVAADVTNLSCVLTTLGGPVEIKLISDGSGSSAWAGIERDTASTSSTGTVILYRDATEISRTTFLFSGSASSADWGMKAPPGTISHTDTPAAGTYTYKVHAAPGGGSDMEIYRCKLCVREIF